LRERFLRSGLSDFAAHNAVELLLFYAIPRRDTNPTAHALLDALGTVGGVLAAEPEALLSVHGVGAGVVRLLAAMRRVRELGLVPAPPARRFTGADALGRYFCGLLAGKREAVAVALLDNDLSLVGERVLDGTSLHSAKFSSQAVLELAILQNAPICAVAHVHGDGLALPKGEDLDTAALLRDALRAGGVRLLESYVVSGERYTTLLYRYSGKGTPASAPHLPTVGDGEVDALAELLAAGGCRADARALLSAYGGLNRLLLAPALRHRREGLDERTASLLLLVGALHTYTVTERPVPSATDGAALGAYLCERYCAVGEETVLMLFFDGSGRHVSTCTLGVGSVSEATLSCRRMSEGAIYTSARGAVLAHNHPHGTAHPSDEDRRTTATVAGMLAGLGIEFLGHYIVAGKDFSVIK
jgi:DNA repair protein RadC